MNNKHLFKVISNNSGVVAKGFLLEGFLLEGFLLEIRMFS